MSLEKSTTKFGHCCCFLSLSLPAAESFTTKFGLSPLQSSAFWMREVEERRLEVSCSQTLYFVSVSLSHTHTGTHRSRLPCLNNKRSLEKRSAPSWIKIFFLELLEGSGFDAGLGGKRSRPLSVRACACVSMFQRV